MINYRIQIFKRTIGGDCIEPIRNKKGIKHGENVL